MSKSLKTSRAPEVEAWKQLVSSLEERIRTHQEVHLYFKELFCFFQVLQHCIDGSGFSKGGPTANLDPTKLVGKLLNFFDSTAHKVVGGMPPPVPSTSLGTAQYSDHYTQPMGNRVPASQSTMAMLSLMPSESDCSSDGDTKPKHNRSISEPDFCRSPRHVRSLFSVTGSQKSYMTLVCIGKS